jgi:hypothetical protein
MDIYLEGILCWVLEVKHARDDDEMASNFSPSRESPSLSAGWEEVDTPSLKDLTRVQRESSGPQNG